MTNISLRLLHPDEADEIFDKYLDRSIYPLCFGTLELVPVYGDVITLNSDFVKKTIVDIEYICNKCNNRHYNFI